MTLHNNMQAHACRQVEPETGPAIAACVDLAIKSSVFRCRACMHSMTSREIRYSPVLHIGGSAELASEQKFGACHS